MSSDFHIRHYTDKGPVTNLLDSKDAFFHQTVARAHTGATDVYGDKTLKTVRCLVAPFGRSSPIYNAWDEEFAPDAFDNAVEQINKRETVMFFTEGHNRTPASTFASTYPEFGQPGSMRVDIQREGKDTDGLYVDVIMMDPMSPPTQHAWSLMSQNVVQDISAAFMPVRAEQVESISDRPRIRVMEATIAEASLVHKGAHHGAALKAMSDTSERSFGIGLSSQFYSEVSGFQQALKNQEKYTQEQNSVLNSNTEEEMKSPTPPWHRPKSIFFPSAI